MSNHSLAYLKHIQDECAFILSAIDENMDKNVFLQNETLKRAIIRSLEIIGEATKKISADVKYEWSEIHWREMAGMRDRLIHDYMGVNYFIVWDVVKNKIPHLYKEIAIVIEKQENKK